MAAITGRLVVILTVSDPERSAAWYGELLGAEETGRYVHPDGRVGQVCLTERQSGLEICLVGHASNPGEAFSEYRSGLDHLEFLVPSRDDLDAWATRLDTLAIDHSGVKQPSYTSNAMITFRDPDNIQLEFFWRSPPP
ncbi:MAG TPA: VOC family protein [Mycobacteriales bacterium]|nr:VOC family protein [Mycobacteriales bacterium]